MLERETHLVSTLSSTLQDGVIQRGIGTSDIVAILTNRLGVLLESVVGGLVGFGHGCGCVDG